MIMRTTGRCWEEAVDSRRGSRGHRVTQADLTHTHTQRRPHLQDGCGCVVDGQDVADVVLSQQLLVSSICAQKKQEIANTPPVQSQMVSCRLKPKLSIFCPSTTQPPPPPSLPQMCPKQMWPSGFSALFLNWKKNRKTNVSKTGQQLGPKARNSTCSNQILFFERKPNVLHLGQMCLHLGVLMLCKLAGCRTRPRLAAANPPDRYMTHSKSSSDPAAHFICR